MAHIIEQKDIDGKQTLEFKREFVRARFPELQQPVKKGSDS